MTVKLCECGCGQPAPVAKRTTSSMGWYKDKPKRFIRGHNNTRHIGWVEEDRGYETPCHIWQGSVVRSYGQRAHTVPGEVRAHRVAWVLAHGPIPQGLYVLHRCDVRLCVNVDHLFLGTAADNAHDAMRKDRHCSGERHGNAKLTWEKVRAIREAKDTSPTELAERFDISRDVIYRVRNGKAWKDAA